MKKLPLFGLIICAIVISSVLFGGCSNRNNNGWVSITGNNAVNINLEKQNIYNTLVLRGHIDIMIQMWDSERIEIIIPVNCVLRKVNINPSRSWTDQQLNYAIDTLVVYLSHAHSQLLFEFMGIITHFYY